MDLAAVLYLNYYASLIQTNQIVYTVFTRGHISTMFYIQRNTGQRLHLLIAHDNTNMFKPFWPYLTLHSSIQQWNITTNLKNIYVSPDHFTRNPFPIWH
jgi:hypothetical protein